MDSIVLEVYNNLGDVLRIVGKLDEEIACYDTCLQLQESDPRALTNLGAIYMEWNMVSLVASPFFVIQLIYRGCQSFSNSCFQFAK